MKSWVIAITLLGLFVLIGGRLLSQAQKLCEAPDTGWLACGTVETADQRAR